VAISGPRTHHHDDDAARPAGGLLDINITPLTTSSWCCSSSSWWTSTALVEAGQGGAARGSAGRPAEGAAKELQTAARDFTVAILKTAAR